MTSRLRSDIFVSALVRQAQSRGDFATILHKGAPEAGAIAVVVVRSDRLAALLLPASQSHFDEAKPAERHFRMAFKDGFVPEFEVSAKIERERRFDPDLWVVEIESRDGVHGLDLTD